MDDFAHKQEVEKLARTLRQSRVASSESDAYRMASEMLATSKKVHEDHKMREREIYGEHLPNAEQQKAKLIIEKLSENLAKGKSNVRIDMEELNLNKPLKDMVKEEEQPAEDADEDDAILVNEESLKHSAEISQELNMPVITEDEAAHGDEDDFHDDDEDDSTEEEKDTGSFVKESEKKDSGDDSDELVIREV